MKWNQCYIVSGLLNAGKDLGIENSGTVNNLAIIQNSVLGSKVFGTFASKVCFLLQKWYSINFQKHSGSSRRLQNLLRLLQKYVLQ